MQLVLVFDRSFIDENDAEKTGKKSKFYNTHDKRELRNN